MRFAPNAFSPRTPAMGGVTTGTPGLAARIAASISASPITTDADVQE